jgi:glycosyltransferase involved in cell wall biosynthesis
LTTLHVDLGKQWRGGQNQALLLIQGLRSRGHGAELVAVEGSPLAQRARAAGVRVHGVSPVARQFLAALPLKTALRRSRFDLVHCHDAHALTAARLSAAHREAAVVASRRVAYTLSRTIWGLGRYQCARYIIAVSRFVRDGLIGQGLPGEQVEVVYDGVELPRLPSPEERADARRRWMDDAAPLIGCVGYLLPEKGQELLIRALPLVRERHGGCRLLLAGDGPCRSELEALSTKLGVREAVRFAGVVEDVTAVYQALDAFLFPSSAEPLGSSLLAAMAHALPVVALARGAVPEMVEDGKSGLLLPEPDVSALAAAVTRLLDDAALRNQLGQAARRTIEERFTADRMIDRTLDLYRRASGR